MIIEILDTVYETFGTPYPRISLAVIMVAGALAFGLAWATLAKRHEDRHPTISAIDAETRTRVAVAAEQQKIAAATGATIYPWRVDQQTKETRVWGDNMHRRVTVICDEGQITATFTVDEKEPTDRGTGNLPVDLGPGGSSTHTSRIVRVLLNKGENASGTLWVAKE